MAEVSDGKNDIALRSGIDIDEHERPTVIPGQQRKAVKTTFDMHRADQAAQDS
jgi:hypothetical protein